MGQVDRKDRLPWGGGKTLSTKRKKQKSLNRHRLLVDEAPRNSEDGTITALSQRKRISLERSIGGSGEKAPHHLLRRGRDRCLL